MVGLAFEAAMAGRLKGNVQWASIGKKVPSPVLSAYEEGFKAGVKDLLAYLEGGGVVKVEYQDGKALVKGR